MTCLRTALYGRFGAMVMDFVIELVDDVPGILVVERVVVGYGVGGGGGPE